jgi:hypothetical protein
MRGVPCLQGADRGSRAHLRRGYELVGDPGAATINAKKRVDSGPREVLELEIQKLEMWMVGPLWGAGGRSDSGHHQS